MFYFPPHLHILRLGGETPHICSRILAVHVAPQLQESDCTDQYIASKWIHMILSISTPCRSSLIGIRNLPSNIPPISPTPRSIFARQQHPPLPRVSPRKTQSLSFLYVTTTRVVTTPRSRPRVAVLSQRPSIPPSTSNIFRHLCTSRTSELLSRQHHG